MEFQDYFFIGFFGLIYGFGILIAIFGGVVGIYYLFRRKKKLHQLPPRNTNFKLNQGEEMNKKSNEKEQR